MKPIFSLALLPLALSACAAPNDADETGAIAATSDIADGDEAQATIPPNFRALGTEPFWAAHVNDGQLRYMTPEDQEGVQFEVTRQQDASEEAVLTGTMAARPFRLVVRVAPCSDGMSDREYPFTVTLTLGGKDADEERRGCARPTESAL